jgi:hypothetical protein
MGFSLRGDSVTRPLGARGNVFADSQFLVARDRVGRMSELLSGKISLLFAIHDYV